MSANPNFTPHDDGTIDCIVCEGGRKPVFHLSKQRAALGPAVTDEFEWVLTTCSMCHGTGRWPLDEDRERWGAGAA